VKEIKLTKGKSCKVDDDDYDFLNQFGWCCWDDGSGYYYAHRWNPNGKVAIRMHRMLAAAGPDDFVDHADGDGLNNQRSNLRICTRSQNTVNSPARKGKRYSNYKGVSAVWNKNKTKKYWTAQSRKNGDLHHIGCFPDEVSAARAYDKKAKELFGDFARLNFPEETI